MYDLFTGSVGLLCTTSKEDESSKQRVKVITSNSTNQLNNKSSNRRNIEKQNQRQAIDESYISRICSDKYRVLAQYISTKKAPSIEDASTTKKL